MAELVLQTAIGNYGHTTPLKDGTVTSGMFDMEHIEVSPVTSIFRRMVRGLEFDVCGDGPFDLHLCPFPRQAFHRHPGLSDPGLLSRWAGI